MIQKRKPKIPAASPAKNQMTDAIMMISIMITASVPKHIEAFLLHRVTGWNKLVRREVRILTQA
jgi:hypothetical protein